MKAVVNTGTVRPLYFEPFLHQLKQSLGYAFDISKYKQLLKFLKDFSLIQGKISIERLYAVCTLLFLQRLEDKNIFDGIFRDYVAAELDFEAKSLLKKKADPISKKKEEEISGVKPAINEDKVDAAMDAEPPDELEVEETSTVKKFFNLTIPSVEGDAKTSGIAAKNSHYLLTDAYLPLTTREMIHGWRHLRKRMRHVPGNRLDVGETVKQFAKEGLLLEPVFDKEQINSDDLLLILADRKGSMVPFHKLTDKLIETAVKDGGHRHALIYYFYNCPVNYVFKDANLTDPVPLSELYSMIRPDHTNALIISDAGASRGNMNNLRVEKTMEFLYGNNELKGLHKAALFVAWLNPMPRHRWQDTTAATVDRAANTPMYSLMDDGYTNFLHLIDKLMGR